MHEEFKKLFYFISLVDNNKIPTVIKELISNKATVDSFVFHLNKHSLITNIELIDSITTFSIHKATHEVIKKFIKNEHEIKDKLPLL
jgi:protease II